MKSWLATIFVIAFATTAHAQTVERIVITDPGLYRFEVEKVDRTPDSVSTGFKTIKNVELIRKTERVPGVLGTSFGFRFEIIGAPKDTPVTLRFVTRFPAPGLRDPKSGRVLLVSENDRQFRIGDTSSRSYSFDEEWEIVPGVWTLEFWFNGKMVGAQKFEVVKADAPANSDRGDAPADTPAR